MCTEKILPLIPSSWDKTHSHGKMIGEVLAVTPGGDEGSETTVKFSDKLTLDPSTKIPEFEVLAPRDCFRGYPPPVGSADATMPEGPDQPAAAPVNQKNADAPLTAEQIKSRRDPLGLTLTAADIHDKLCVPDIPTEGPPEGGEPLDEPKNGILRRNLRKVGGVAGAVAGKAQDVAAAGASKVGDAAGAVAGKAKNAAVGGVTAAKNAAKDAAGAAVDAAENAKDKAEDLAEDAKEAAEEKYLLGKAYAGTAVDTAKEKMQDAAGNVKDAAGGAKDAALGKVKDVAGNVKDVVAEKVGGVVEKVAPPEQTAALELGRTSVGRNRNRGDVKGGGTAFAEDAAPATADAAAAAPAAAGDDAAADPAEGAPAAAEGAAAAEKKPKVRLPPGEALFRQWRRHVPKPAPLDKPLKRCEGLDFKLPASAWTPTCVKLIKDPAELIQAKVAPTFSPPTPIFVHLPHDYLCVSTVSRTWITCYSIFVAYLPSHTVFRKFV